MLSLLFTLNTPKTFPIQEPKTAQIVYADPIIHISPIQPISALPELELKELPELELKLPEQPIVSSGNTYYYRQCVWYVKERRPEIPNSWSNATEWMANAQAMGWPTGNEPRAGAVGWVYGHVVYVERVNDDGTIYISEMNYDYNGSYRERTASASEFKYIY